MPQLQDIVFKIHSRGGQTVSFLNHDTDESGTPMYYGFAHPDNGFMIMQVTTTATRYYIGKDSYETAWAARASLSYDYIYNLL